MNTNSIEIKDEIRNVLKNTSSLSGSMFGCVKIYEVYEVPAKEFLKLLKEIDNNCIDLEYVIKLFEDEDRLMNFIRNHRDSIEEYTKVYDTKYKQKDYDLG